MVAATEATLTTAPPLPASAAWTHRAERVFHAEPDAENVDVAHLADVGGLEIDDERGDLDARVVDENVEAAELGDRGLDRRGPLLVVGDVEIHEIALGARLRQSCGRLPAALLENVGDHDRRAGIGERRRDSGADAARASRHQGAAARQLSTHGVPHFCPSLRLCRPAAVLSFVF